VIEDAVREILAEMDEKKLFAKKAHRDAAEAILRKAIGSLLMNALLPAIDFKKMETCPERPLPSQAVTPPPPLDPHRPQAQ